MNKRVLKDGGYASRKFWLTVATSGSIIALGALAALHPVFGPNLDTVVGGLLGALAIYMGANVGAKYTIGKTTKQTEPPPEEPPQD